MDQNNTSSPDKSIGRRPSIPVNMHPTRMLQLAQGLAARPDATDDVRTLAAMVAALCHQVDQVNGKATRAESMGRRMGR